jgi:outer membrane lipopolysaccharide assembly protein LptE/RlpB
MRLAVAVLAVSSIFLGSCGYHTAGAQAARLPTDIKTLAIPAFTNKTQTYKVEQQITAAVVREMMTRTKYRVVYDDTSGADATLRGVVTQTELSPLTYDSLTGRASSAIVVVHLDVALVDSKGKMLYSNPNYLFREQYQVSREISSFFEEQSPAMQRLARDVAKTLVSDILESY